MDPPRERGVPGGSSPWASTSPNFPPSRLVDAFDQVVEPLIAEITCLRSHEPWLFYLVNAYVGSPPGEVRTSGAVTPKLRRGRYERHLLAFGRRWLVLRSSPVDGLTVIAAASGEDGPEPTSATGRAGARRAP